MFICRNQPCGAEWQLADVLIKNEGQGLMFRLPHVWRAQQGCSATTRPTAHHLRAGQFGPAETCRKVIHDHAYFFQRSAAFAGDAGEPRTARLSHDDPIQAASLPIALAGHDLIAQAKTGSGKTAAFALPLLAKIDPRLFSVQALVLCPTRELADQVTQEIRRSRARKTTSRS